MSHMVLMIHIANQQRLRKKGHSIEWQMRELANAGMR